MLPETRAWNTLLRSAKMPTSIAVDARLPTIERVHIRAQSGPRGFYVEHRSPPPPPTTPPPPKWQECEVRQFLVLGFKGAR